MDTLRIFISSPSDVVQERALTQRIIESLQGRFMGYVKLEPIFWSHEPLLASAAQQDSLILPSQTDIMVCILWSRLNSHLPPSVDRPDNTPYASGTEFEFENGLNAFTAKGKPEILVYHNSKKPVVILDDEALLLEKIEQKKALEHFINKSFTNIDGTVKSMFQTYVALDDFETRLEQQLQVLIEQQIEQRGLTDVDNDFASSRQLLIPWRGLEAFTAAHEKLFFGRTREIHEVIHALHRQADHHRTFLLILGASGSGKSSLVRAGVIPMLTRPGVVNDVVDWRQATLSFSNSGASVMDILVDSLLQPEALPELHQSYPDQAQLVECITDNPDTLNALIQRILKKVAADKVKSKVFDHQSEGLKSGKVPQARLLLVIDQFEELFINNNITDAQRRLFIELIDILARSGWVWVISTLRNDFYAYCGEYERLIRLKEDHGQYDLLAPVASQLAQMIRRPALFSGLTFETGPAGGPSLDEVLLDGASNTAHSLPLLSFTLEALYDNRTEEGKLTFAAYEALGGLEGALAKRAESVLSQLSEDVQATLPEVFEWVVKTNSNYSAIRKRSAYDPESHATHSDNHKKLVEAFISARLFVGETNSQGQVMISVAHEALIVHWPRLADWVESQRTVPLGPIGLLEPTGPSELPDDQASALKQAQESVEKLQLSNKWLGWFSVASVICVVALVIARF
ncbi:MAG: energy-coupling factor transporter ATP-binding protein EcfA2 [Phenylobacterium sp.]|jgi:energy-coupling factor transporter ATP-binding protein EcfA2